MDHVYICRPGENEELRYSLRSLAKFVPHDNVVIIGDWPKWLTEDHDVIRRVRNVPLGAGGFATTSHIRLACLLDWISDPFVLWNDDMYATEPTEVGVWHNGPVGDQIRRHGGVWGAGQLATYAWLKTNTVIMSPLSYELHVPLTVHKTGMLHALNIADDIGVNYPHKRTLYGNLMQLGGEYRADCKVTNARTTIDGPWISSADPTFRSCVLPRLTMLSEPSRFES